MVSPPRIQDRLGQLQLVVDHFPQVVLIGEGHREGLLISSRRDKKLLISVPNIQARSCPDGKRIAVLNGSAIDGNQGGVRR